MIIVPLKEHIAVPASFGNKHATAGILKQRMIASSPVKLKTVPFTEWMIATLSVTNRYPSSRFGWLQ